MDEQLGNRQTVPRRRLLKVVFRLELLLDDDLLGFDRDFRLILSFQHFSADFEFDFLKVLLPLRLFLAHRADGNDDYALKTLKEGVNRI